MDFNYPPQLVQSTSARLSEHWEKAIVSVAGAKYEGIMKRSFESPIPSHVITKNMIKRDMM